MASARCAFLRCLRDTMPDYCKKCHYTQVRSDLHPDGICRSCEDTMYSPPLPLERQHPRLAYCFCAACKPPLPEPEPPRERTPLIYFDAPELIARAMEYVRSIPPNRQVQWCSRDVCGAPLYRGRCTECGAYDEDYQSRWQGLRIHQGIAALPRRIK